VRPQGRRAPTSCFSQKNICRSSGFKGNSAAVPLNNPLPFASIHLWPKGHKVSLGTTLKRASKLTKLARADLTLPPRSRVDTMIWTDFNPSHRVSVTDRKQVRNSIDRLRYNVLNHPESMARDYARRSLSSLEKIAKERSRKARKLLKARKKAHAARKAGFIVKRKK